MSVGTARLRHRRLRRTVATVGLGVTLAACTPVTAPAEQAAASRSEPAAASAEARGAPSRGTSPAVDPTPTAPSTARASETAVVGPAITCGTLRDDATAILAAAGLGTATGFDDGPDGCTIEGQRGDVRVVAAGTVDLAAYLAATGFGSDGVTVGADGEPVTASNGGVAAAATTTDDGAVVVRLERSIEGRDEDQAVAVLELVLAALEA